MRKNMLWKSLAGTVATFSVLLVGAGVAGAATPAANEPGSPGYGAPINCATAEHAGFGLLYHAIDKDCSGMLGGLGHGAGS
jgi:hypothetical protein